MVVMFAVLSCTNTPPPTPKDLAKENLIPKPVSLTATGSSFAINDQTVIYLQGNTAELQQIGNYLAEKLKPATGFGMQVQATEEAPASGHFYLTLTGDKGQYGDEGYELSISEEQVKLSAPKPAGLFRGIQTIRQLLPAKIELGTPQEGPWEIATGTIRDYPGYAYRGAMLDVSRHFFQVDDVKRFIDLIATYKMNILHLHLADDQGWRIEIKSWPNLTLHGGQTQVGGGEGGYYTQEQYTDLVNYAQERYITIVPEIDMPGHTNAALSSYAELNCDGKATKLYTGTDVGFSTLCTKKEVVYVFIEDVIRELAALTPGPYIHVGGDESHVTALEDYIPFINRVQDIVQTHGKMMIGWDEVTEARLNPTSVAQYWAKAENAQKAVAQGAKVIISPAKKAYMDMQYDSTTQWGLHWAGYIEVDSGYIWNPATLVEGVTKENILGVEAPLWTETITNMEEIEYMVFPRLPGYAEIAWSAGPNDWEEYKVRLGQQKARFEAMDINYYPSDLVPWASQDTTKEVH
ncbi:MAG: beta-N-acetylhexosaminidase [Saprospiraceae bacterium]|nr:MAG: beta-N-acetylhexosaminidase [Saprospiraceae bacterium]